jgi:hypothetical protein
VEGSAINNIKDNHRIVSVDVEKFSESLRRCPGAEEEMAGLESV